ncbi:unnamed protein product [Ectocarpus sp. 13 AM-2016]
MTPYTKETNETHFINLQPDIEGHPSTHAYTQPLARGRHSENIAHSSRQHTWNDRRPIAQLPRPVCVPLVIAVTYDTKKRSQKQNARAKKAEKKKNCTYR